jgi:dTDP-4-amino-4,6-dideoxygalactose transaminase
VVTPDGSGGIRFLDLRRLHESIAEDLRVAFADVVDRNAFVGAGASRTFEVNLAAAHGRRAAAGCGSGTDALALALRALGIGPGDEVVVPAMTFVATLEAVVHAGATPIVADVEPDTLLLSPAAVAAVRTPRTRAVIPVHLYGHIVSFAWLEEWRSSGLVVVEDAAQAHLGQWEGRGVGEVGHAACLSFYPGKNLGALGDGGAVVSDDLRTIEEVKRLRDHGRVSKYDHDVIGWCSRLDGLQAAFLDVKLAHLPAWTQARRQLADRYRSLLGDAVVPWERGAVHHLLVVRVPGGRRDEVQNRLAGAKIESGVHFPVPLSRQKSCSPYWTVCPVAERAADEVLSLPMDPLMSVEEVDRVCAVVSEELLG